MNGLLFILALSGFSEVADAIGRTEEGFCLQSQHSCNDISCIPQSHVCNGDEECVDGSDEVGCADAPTCSGGLIPCPKTTGVTSCVETQEQCSQPTGCGALPNIDNGEASFLGFGNKKSSIGAWADIICNEGYKSCTNKIRCLESGVWTTTVCEPEQPGIQCKANNTCGLSAGSCSTPGQKCYIDDVEVILPNTGSYEFEHFEQPIASEEICRGMCLSVTTYRCVAYSYNPPSEQCFTFTKTPAEGLNTVYHNYSVLRILTCPAC
ncbi:very low-density lipoprotein receptor-like [Ruditapes philippinarum]|uniref:very low-density lipoprotein receptor-like n=1 Tax=Ruditapes philippinarum TaxID=129788 RepID=UPI00295B7F17|nr:very low-density lipoprotein receptor-like [Ruditapes philippinarum]